MIHPFIRDHSKEFPGFHPQIHRPSGFLKQRFSHFTDLEKEGVGMTSFKEETNSEIESMANGFAVFFFLGNTPSRTEVDCDTVQRTGVLLSSTTSDQIRRILKRLMLEVRVATKP